ncbi:MAG: sulfite exporter TauE/SafE family protein [Micrococcales bacterium]|nr:sulfite exporter TauE/SafE family protein [Micrococcales bacterium]
MFQDLTLATALFLLAASFFAGFIDSIAGGGGLIQLPALLIGLPKSETAEVLGTNKLSAVFGTTTAAALYRKQIKPDPKILIAMGVPAFAGSAGGAVLASKIPTSSMRPMVLVLLVIVAVYSWFKPDLGKFENLRHLPKRRVQIAAFAGVVIGFYDGIFGPGTGSFLMLILVASLGYAFITASAIAKVINVATNIGPIMVFGINGAVLWQIGIILGIANITGAVIGARLAIKGGSTLVRKVFLLVTVALIVKVGIATF